MACAVQLKVSQTISTWQAASHQKREGSASAAKHLRGRNVFRLIQASSNQIIWILNAGLAWMSSRWTSAKIIAAKLNADAKLKQG